MNKLISFVRMDFLTIKPYLTLRNMPLFLLLVFFLAMLTDGINAGISLGIMISTLMISYPFQVGEKNSLDALYITLSINRRTVVLGRFLFVFVFNVCTIVLSLVVATAAQLFSQLIGYGNATSGFSWLVLLLGAAFLIVQAIQLPIYFKLGYSRAKFLSVVPLVVIISSYLAISMLSGADTTSTLPLLDPLYGAGLAVLAVVALAAVVFVSYRLSALLYRGREF